jgi:hypothetical protein
MSAVTRDTLRVGGKYNWQHQKERLVYMGMCEPRNGRWHQFALVEKPDAVWCEVRDSDLAHFEETPAAAEPTPEAIEDFLAARMTNEGRVPMIATIREALTHFRAPSGLITVARSIVEQFDAYEAQRGAVRDRFKHPSTGVEVANSVTIEVAKLRALSALLKGEPAEPMAEANPNAPWLTLAHALCSDQDIDAGHITDRLKALREKLDEAKAAEGLNICPVCATVSEATSDAVDASILKTVLPACYEVIDKLLGGEPDKRLITEARRLLPKGYKNSFQADKEARE